MWYLQTLCVRPRRIRLEIGEGKCRIPEPNFPIPKERRFTD